MFSPECLYWVALFTLVLPSIPFNRSAVVVLASWAFGYFAHITGPYEFPVMMFARIVAFGAALGISKPWDGSRRAYAHGAVALLFLPVAALSAYGALYFDHDPANWREYYAQSSVYWATWVCIMAQAMMAPAGNDWKRIGQIVRKIDTWIMMQIIKRFGSAI